MGAFLPDGYEPPKTGGRYTKFEDGKTTRIRIMSEPIIGWMYWDKKGDKAKPIRLLYNSDNYNRALEAASKNQKVEDRAVKHFWAMVVWNYETKRTEVMEITQKTIQSDIMSLTEDPDFGKPFSYDLKITRTKNGDKTEYGVIPGKEVKTPDDATEHLQNNPINLIALYYSADPFDTNWEEPFEDIETPSF